MKRITVATVAAVLLLGLTGCADTSGGAETATVSASEQGSLEATPSASRTETPDPLSVGDTESAGEGDVETAFLDEVDSRLSSIQSQIPDATEEQLLSAGHEACERLAGGESGENMTLIEGEETTGGYYMDSSAIIIAARLTLCPIEP